MVRAALYAMAARSRKPGTTHVFAPFLLAFTLSSGHGRFDIDRRFARELVDLPRRSLDRAQTHKPNVRSGIAASSAS